VYEQEGKLAEFIGNQRKSKGFPLYGGCLVAPEGVGTLDAVCVYTYIYNNIYICRDGGYIERRKGRERER